MLCLCLFYFAWTALYGSLPNKNNVQQFIKKSSESRKIFLDLLIIRHSHKSVKTFSTNPDTDIFY